MSYSDLSETDQVLLAIQFVAQGSPVPTELEQCVGPELMEDIRNPQGE